MNLALTTRTKGDVAFLYCRGRLVYERQAAALCDAVKGLVRQYRSVVVDLNDVSDIDGRGIGTLAECVANAKESGARLILCRVPRKVRTVLDLTHISSLVDITTSEHDAWERSRAAA